MADVINYDNNAVFNGYDFELVLRDYFLTEVQFFFTAQEIDSKCQRENVKVLYFYDESSFDTQGDILGYLKKLFKQKMLVFSFNSEFHEEPMIDLLLSSYNITQYPAVVIEGKTYQGQRNIKEMMRIVCSEFKEIGEVPKECRIIN
ncbi:MAG: hypothetical protein ISS01_02655 [Nanoarchaeota archaeon]|nr:hypothetical protein [Nanoarchaeota archaeon]